MSAVQKSFNQTVNHSQKGRIPVQEVPKTAVSEQVEKVNQQKKAEVQIQQELAGAK